MTIAGIGLASATPGKGMYKMILAADALEDASSTLSSANECQNPALYKKSLVDGKVLICSYSKQFVFGSSTVKNVSDTVKALSGIGVVMVITPELDGQFSIGVVPFSVPAIIISRLNDTEAVLDCYKKSPNFSATTRINGGAKAKYSNEAPKVASYSSKGAAETASLTGPFSTLCLNVSSTSMVGVCLTFPLRLRGRNGNQACAKLLNAWSQKKTMLQKQIKALLPLKFLTKDLLDPG